jgi:hypothetical protein
MEYSREYFVTGEHGKPLPLMNMQRLYYCPFPVSKTLRCLHSVKNKAWKVVQTLFSFSGTAFFHAKIEYTVCNIPGRGRSGGEFL